MGGASMKTYKRLSAIFSAVMILSLIMAGGAAAKSPNKVDICHNNGNGSYTLLTIKSNTLQTHLSHGDAAPGEAVPGQAGKVFAANCSVTSTAQSATVQVITPPSVTNQGKKASKVDVCHRRGNGTFIMINVNGNALPAHLRHGDGVPNGWVPNQPGKKFTATCSITVIPQKELFQTIIVSSTVQTPVSSEPFLNGQLYEIKVSGTYIFDTLNNWADAEYFSNNGLVYKGDTEYPLTPNILDLSIGGCSTNTDWLVYQPTHVYTMQLTGNGAPLSLCIFDTYYGDNVGSLTVEIWKINW
jgi:hypothetical protein